MMWGLLTYRSFRDRIRILSVAVVHQVVDSLKLCHEGHALLSYTKGGSRFGGTF